VEGKSVRGRGGDIIGLLGAVDAREKKKAKKGKTSGGRRRKKG